MLHSATEINTNDLTHSLRSLLYTDDDDDDDSVIESRLSKFDSKAFIAFYVFVCAVAPIWACGLIYHRTKNAIVLTGAAMGLLAVLLLPFVGIYRSRKNIFGKKIFLEDLAIIYLSILNTVMLVGRYAEGHCSGADGFVQNAFCNQNHPALPLDITLPNAMSIVIYPHIFVGSRMKVVFLSWVIHYVPMATISVIAYRTSASTTLGSIFISNLTHFFALYVIFKLNSAQQQVHAEAHSDASSIASSVVARGPPLRVGAGGAEVGIDLNFIYGRNVDDVYVNAATSGILYRDHASDTETTGEFSDITSVL